MASPPLTPGKPDDLVTDSPDRPLLDLIRRRGPLTVAAMVASLGVTPTAVRNRLTRLVESGMVERRVESGGRGRPRHTYQASLVAHQRLGQNYADLAVALWGELMHEVPDTKLRRLLFGRVTEKLAEQYRSEIRGAEWQGRVGLGEGVVRARVLAEADRTVCALERKMFEKVLGRSLRLSRCRLDGHRSCDFEAKPLLVPGVVPLA